MTFKVEQTIHVSANKCWNVLIHCHPWSAALRFYTSKCASPSHQLHINSGPSRIEYTVNVVKICSSHNQTPSTSHTSILLSCIYLANYDLVNSHHVLQKFSTSQNKMTWCSEVLVKITFDIHIFPSNRNHSCMILCTVNLRINLTSMIM